MDFKVKGGVMDKKLIDIKNYADLGKMFQDFVTLEKQGFIVETYLGDGTYGSLSVYVR